MGNDVSIIGGADGPTSVFLAGELGTKSIINIFGLIIVLLILVPNIIYAIRVKDQENKCQNKIMNILEQIGRYGCMFPPWGQVPCTFYELLLIILLQYLTQTW